VVVLEEIEVNAALPVPLPMVGFQKKPALVTVDDRLDPQDAGQRSFTHSDHQEALCTWVILKHMLRYTLRI
jgi:hypothetical protein